MSLSNLDIAKLNFQQVNPEDLLKNAKAAGLDSLRSLLTSKEQELKDKFLTAILKIMQDAGIDITTMPPKLPDLCPTKEILDKVIEIRNKLVINLNGLSKTLNIVAGTVTTVAAHVLKLTKYDPDVLHGAEIESEQISQTVKDFIRLTPQERKNLAYMHEGRVEVITAGSIVLDEVIKTIGAKTLITSEKYILDGVAWSQVQ